MTDKKNEPALQNIPLRTTLGRDVRKALAYELPPETNYASLEERILQTLIEENEREEGRS